MTLEIGAGSLDWILRRLRQLPRDASLLAGLAPSGAAWARAAARPADWDRLARDPGRLLVLLSGQDRIEPAPVRALAEPAATAPTDWLAFLIPRAAPPRHGARDDGPVHSVACTPAIFRATIAQPCGADRLAYEVARAALVERPVPLALHVFGRPDVPAHAPAVDDAPLTWLIPHRGDPAHLDVCLRQVAAAAAPRDQVWVCFDEPPAPAQRELVAVHRAVHFWRATPCGLGPYVARHVLGQAVPTELLLFQDSDDVPMHGRRAALVHELRRTGCDLIGSHELRLDERKSALVAVRFPLDASAALAQRADHALFHPTSLVRVDALRRAGGFSTARRFGADLQFLLRAHFTMRIRNCDAFLYLRRKREGSLTTSPTTGLGAPRRRTLAEQWKADFDRVKRGELALHASSLAVAHHPDLARIRFTYLSDGPSPLRRVARNATTQ